MPRPCSVCTHPQHAEIDKALIGGESYRDVAGRFGVPKSSLGRHKSEHLHREVAATQARRVARQKPRVRSLADYVTEQMEQAVEIRDRARAEADTDDKAMARWIAASRVATETARVMAQMARVADQIRR